MLTDARLQVPGFTYEVDDRRGDPEGREAYRHEEDLHGAAPEGGEVEEGRRVVRAVLLLDLPLLVLEVQDGPALRVVERRRAVEGPHQEGEDDHPRHRLQAKAPSYGPVQEGRQ